MVKVFEKLFPPHALGNPNRTAGMYMDEDLKSNIMLAKKEIRKDWDMVFVLDGAEGSGKSVITQQIAFACDPHLTLENVVFRPDEFKEAILKANKYQAIIYDEAYGGLSSRKAMTQTNKALVDMLTEIRQKNLFIFIVLPTFFDLDKYAALWRSRALIHVYTMNFKRGFFRFYNYQQKKNLYVNGKKFYSYSKSIAKPNFEGRFTDFYPLGKEAYKKKKLESLRAYEDSKEEEVTVRRTDVFRDQVIFDLHDKGLKYGEISDYLEKKFQFIISETFVGKIIRNKGKMHGYG